MWQKLGCWKRQSKLEARSVHNDSYFLPHIFRAAADGVFRLEGLGVLEEPGTQLLPFRMLLSCRATLWLSALAVPAHRGRAFLKHRHYSLVFIHELRCPAHFFQLTSWSWICNHTWTAAAFLLSRAESLWWQQCLQTPGEVLKHFRCCSTKH